MNCFMATALVAISALVAAPQSPQWEPSYGKALEETRHSEEPLLVVLDKPGSKSDRLAPELIDSSVEHGKLLRPYKLCRVDVSTKYGRKVAKAFGAKSFPHVAIIDKTGSTVIFKKSGQIQAKEWQGILARHRSGDRALARSVSRTSYKPSGDIGPDVLRPSCPNCQRNSF